MTLERAAMLLDLGRPDEALEMLSTVAVEDLEDAAPLRARALLSLGRPEEAAQAAAAARAAGPLEPSGYVLGAFAALARGHLREATGLATEAVRLAPDEVGPQQLAAIVWLQVGDLPQARCHSEEMLRLAPHLAWSHETHARVLQAQGQLAEAESAVRRALSLDPQDVDCMSLLADISSALGRTEEAKELRLSAVRANPQSGRLQAMLLKQGAVATAGGLAVLAKVGAVKGLLLIAAAHNIGPLWRAKLASGAAALGVLAACFVVSRVRRHRYGRTLPPLVWQGLRPMRRNQDLLWPAVPSGLVLLGGAAVAGWQALHGRSPTGALAVAAVSGAVLAVCWRLRQGAAKQLRLRDVFSGLGEGLRTVSEGVAARHGRQSRQLPLVRGNDPTADERLVRAILALSLVFVIVVGAAARSPLLWAGPVAGLLCAAGVGAVVDHIDHPLGGRRTRIVRAGSTNRAGRRRLAARAALRVVLLPVLVCQVAGHRRQPVRFLHDRLSGTECIGLVPQTAAPFGVPTGPAASAAPARTTR